MTQKRSGNLSLPMQACLSAEKLWSGGLIQTTSFIPGKGCWKTIGYIYGFLSRLILTPKIEIYRSKDMIYTKIPHHKSLRRQKIEKVTFKPV